MAWAVPAEWKDWVTPVKDELTLVIQTISEFEPVWLLTPSSAIRDARSRFEGCNVEVVEAPVNDIWMRDIAPTFALRGKSLLAIDWNFKGWGAAVTDRRIQAADVKPHDAASAALGSDLAALLGIPYVRAPFVAEGGAMIADGQGTLITTRSCLLNSNRNAPVVGPDNQSRIEQALRSLGIRKVIWLKGDPDEPITSGHIDGYVMLAPERQILVESVEDVETCAPLWREHDIFVLERTTDAAGRPVQVQRVCAPRRRYWKYRGRSWAPCYLNAYVANGAVIGACFGDVERDSAVRDALRSAFPGRKLVMLRIDHIASGGGGIRCLTQPLPATNC